LRAERVHSALREQTGKDPAAAAKRLDALAGTPDYAPAVRGFVDETVRRDPAGAADWALSIGESAPLHRISALERVASAWLRKDPDAARRGWKPRRSRTLSISNSRGVHVSVECTARLAMVRPQRRVAAFENFI
jgi:hypothetical protein